MTSHPSVQPAGARAPSAGVRAPSAGVRAPSAGARARSAGARAPLAGAAAEVCSHTNLPPRCRAPDGSWAGLLCAAMALAHGLESEMDGALEIVGLSASGFAAMLEIDREEVTSQESLARRLGRGRSATSELLKRLRRQGLVAPAPTTRGGRKAGATGRRTTGRPAGRPPTPVALTPAGQAVLEKAARIGIKLEHVWALRLSADHPEWPFPTARAVGLRRQLRESAAALQRRGRGR